MNANTHGYPYQPGDIAYVIGTGLVIREGTCVSNNGTNYTFLMADNQHHENYTYDQLYGLKSNAQIAVQTKYTSPTPSVSRSVTPTPSRTPQPSSSATITPTPSSVVYPNLANGSSWGADNGTVTVNGASVAFVSTGGTVDDPNVSFFTSIPVDALANYHFSVRYTQGTCRYATIEVVGSSPHQAVQRLFSVSVGGNGDLVDSVAENSGFVTQDIYIPSGITQAVVTVTLFEDSNYKLPAPNGFTYNFGSIVLQKFMPYVAPSPSPSQATPTPSPTPSPSAGGTHIHNFMSRLTRFAMPDPTFVNLGYMDVKTTIQTADGKIYIGGGGAYGSNNYLTRLNSDGTVDNTFVNLQLDNNVNSMVQTADDKIYLVGAFTTAAGVATTNKLVRLNSDGTFDSTYNVNLGPTQFGANYSSVIQTTDGKIYFSGNYTTPTTMGVRRLNSDGSLDSAYNVSMGFNTNGPVYLHQTADNKIYTLGTFSTVGGHAYLGLARLNSDGTIDTTFSNLNSYNNSYLNMTQTSDGKIYLVGNLVRDDGQASIGIRRLNSDGTIDNTVPQSFTDFAANSARLNAVTQTNDGKIYVGGLASAPGHNNYDYFLRLNSDGSFDNSFVPLGLHAEVDSIFQTTDLKIYIYGAAFANAPQSMIRILDNTGAVTASPTIIGYYTPNLLDKLSDGTILAVNQYENQSHYGVFNINPDASVIDSFTVNDMDGATTGYVQDSSGKIYIAGQFQHIAGVHYNGVARLNSNGVLDTTFVDLGIDASTYITNDIKKTADGKFYVFGNFTQVGSTPMTYIQRLNSNGTIDNTWTNLNLSAGSYATAYTSIQTVDSKIYVVGSFSYNSGQYKNILRLNSNGSVDTTFVDLALNNDAVFDMFQTSTGKIYVLGDFNTIGGHAYTNVARLNSDGTVDTTFVDLGLPDIYHTVQKIVELQNGKFMIIGSFGAGSLTAYQCLARLNADGTVDNTFTNLFQNYNNANGLVDLGSSTCMVSGSFQIF